MQVRALIVAIMLSLAFQGAQQARAAAHKTHAVFFGAPKHVPYSKAGDPAGATPDEKELKIRALVVDGVVKEWTTGDSHDITDRSFVVRRALRLNDSLPGEKPGPGQWVWQRGPWILIDRVSGHVTALKLPDYDPGVSKVSWFRDYAAYCGLTANGKSLYALVAQLAVRKPVLAKKLSALEVDDRPGPACGETEWKREPLQVTFHPAGKDAQSFSIVPGSVALVEESEDEPDTRETKAQPQPK